jgi:hypothetical protein
MPTSERASRTSACVARPGADPADRVSCSGAARRKSRSAITLRPWFPTHTKMTLLMRVTPVGSPGQIRRAGRFAADKLVGEPANRRPHRWGEQVDPDVVEIARDDPWRK